MPTRRVLLLLLLVSTALLGSHLSCKKPTEPTNGNGSKDPRTYTWTVDTITYPGSFQTAMRSIWASGPDNAYIVGHNDNPGTPTMFRYDGAQWRTTNFHASAGGSISGAVSLSKVHGFGPSDVWVAGERIYQVGNTFPDSSFLMHLNGSQWTEATILGGRGRRLQSLWGASPTDIWAAGRNTLLHYDGVQWSHFPIELPGQGIQFFSMSGLSSSEVYMMGYRNDVTPPTDTAAYLLYRFDGSSWSIVDSIVQVLGFPPAQFGLVLGAVASEMYSLSASVYRLTSGTWQLLFTESDPLNAIHGTGRDNFVAVGLGTLVIHYNGSNAYRFPQFPAGGVDFYSVWANQEHIFVVGNDGLKTFVARGN
jgi:hypothetical protein